MFAGYAMGELGSIMAMQGFAGLILFSVFVLMALGLAIIFGQMGVIDMAHGEFMILGAYVTSFTSQAFTAYLPSLFGIYFFVAVVLVDSFLIVVFGGAASLVGTIASAFTISQARSILEFFLSGSMAQVIVLLTVVVILMIRPQGLFALKVRR